VGPCLCLIIFIYLLSTFIDRNLRLYQHRETIPIAVHSEPHHTRPYAQANGPLILLDRHSYKSMVWAQINAVGNGF